jgi:hypothetical protein
MTLEEEHYVNEGKDVPVSFIHQKYHLYWPGVEPKSQQGRFGLLVQYGNPTRLRKSLTTRQHSENSALAYRQCRCNRSSSFRDC